MLLLITQFLLKDVSFRLLFLYNINIVLEDFAFQISLILHHVTITLTLK